MKAVKSKLDIAAQIEDITGMLQSAQNYKGPYVLKINSIDTIVSREEFLDFYIDVIIQDLWELKESIEETIGGTLNES